MSHIEELIGKMSEETGCYDLGQPNTYLFCKNKLLQNLEY